VTVSDLAVHIALACVAGLAGIVLAPVLAGLARWSLGDATADLLSPGWVRALAATVFALCAGTVGPQWDLAAWMVFAAACVTLTLTDCATHRLPNVLVGGFTLLALAALGLASWLASEPDRLVSAVITGLVVFVGFAVLALVHPRGLGFGDVKLAAPIGLYLGWLGWPAAVVGLFAAFTLGALAGVLLAVVRRSGRQTAIPFGPYLLAGVGVCLLVASG
jgi:leader peptidase (prepilin peptidase)/N-methyltransferase